MSEPTPVLPATLEQIRQLHEMHPAQPGRPLVICDVDEVVLLFLAHLEEHMGRSGHRFLSHEYKLTGNIADAAGTLLEATVVRALIQAFFDEWVELQKPVPGASDALASLAGAADVVFLTNLPGAWNREGRIRTLTSHGMAYPLVTNSGPKGGAVAALAAGRSAPVVFIDDSPSNIRSVRDSHAGSTLVHFIADQRFFAGAEDIEGTGLKTHDWRTATTYIRQVIGG